MNRETNRRDFLKSSALMGAGFWVAARSTRAQSSSPNERLNVAAIGAGGKGSSDVNGAAKAGGRIVALCDVDDERAKGTYEKFPDVRRFKDFREMFDKMHKDIDAVTISTPDHMHAPITMMAMRLGKHVYTQKPLCHDVYEARTLTEAAKKYKVVTQMGNQGTASDGLREAVEVVQSGAIGPVREVHVWTNRPIWPQGAGAVLAVPGVQSALHGNGQAVQEVPKNLDWDLWLGTAPFRPYYKGIYHHFAWRGWWDFGTGALGDMACHTANMAFMACKLGYPTAIEAEVSEYNSETYPTWSVIRYDFPARGNLPPLKWTWYDGGDNKPGWVNRKLRELARGEELAKSGSLLIGDKGTLYSAHDYGGKCVLLPKKDFEGFKPPEQTLPRVGGAHYEEWVDACLADNPGGTMSNFSYAGPLTETVLLGCVAIRARKRIEWDGPNMRITNDEKANAFLKREYRKGWEL